MRRIANLIVVNPFKNIVDHCVVIFLFLCLFLAVRPFRGKKEEERETKEEKELHLLKNIMRKKSNKKKKRGKPSKRGDFSTNKKRRQKLRSRNLWET